MHLYLITSSSWFWKEGFGATATVDILSNIEFTICFAYNLICSQVTQSKINSKHANFKDVRFLLLKIRPSVRKRFCHEALHHLLYVIYIVLSNIKENELHSTVTSRIKEIFNVAMKMSLQRMKYWRFKGRTNNVMFLFYQNRWSEFIP